MRGWFLVLAVVTSACSGGQGAATSSPAASTTVIEDTPVVTTTTVPPTTSTTTLTTTVPSGAAGSLAYQEIADLEFPVQVVARPGDDISYVLIKKGLVLGMVDGQILDDPVLDISDRVRSVGEQGLLSIALHPAERALLYLHYSDPDGDTVVSEFGFTSPTDADPGSERVLLTHDQPASNHNGGMILFHPDGRLLVGLGDGGGSGDRFGNGQDTGTLLAGIVALDVTGAPNPELFAHGLRNPWRFWIDEGFLYIADVGQDAYEEISVTPLVSNLNFGWPITEGFHCYRPSTGCDMTGLSLPLVEIPHSDSATCSISGGVVYRGREIPQLDGHYLYSDYCGGYLRSFRYEGEGTPLSEVDWTDQVGIEVLVNGFGVDGAGEVYATTSRSLLKLVVIP